MNIQPISISSLNNNCQSQNKNTSNNKIAFGEYSIKPDIYIKQAKEVVTDPKAFKSIKKTIKQSCNTLKAFYREKQNNVNDISIVAGAKKGEIEISIKPNNDFIAAYERIGGPDSMSKKMQPPATYIVKPTEPPTIELAMELIDATVKINNQHAYPASLYLK